jgi:hypothetical protein
MAKGVDVACACDCAGHMLVAGCWMLAKLVGLFYLEMCVFSACFWGDLAGLVASHEP